MPYSTLRQLPEITPVDGVLIKRAPLAHASRTNNLLREAQSHARALLRDAEREAEACRQHGVRSGYEAGFLLAIEQLANYFNRCRQLQITLRESLVKEITSNLQEFLSEPELLLRLTEKLTNEEGIPGNAPLRVLIPYHAKRIAPVVRRTLTHAFPQVQVVTSNGERLIAEWGEEIVEFDLCETAKELTDAALSTCKEALNAIDDSTLARCVLESTLNQLAPTKQDLQQNLTSDTQ